MVNVDFNFNSIINLFGLLSFFEPQFTCETEIINICTLFTYDWPKGKKRKLSKCMWILYGVEIWGRINNTCVVLCSWRKTETIKRLLCTINCVKLFTYIYTLSLQQCCCKRYFIISILNQGSKESVEKIYIVILYVWGYKAWKNNL